MSRIGRNPIAIPAGVDVVIDGQNVTVKGPKGTLSHDHHHPARGHRVHDCAEVPDAVLGVGYRQAARR